MTLRSALALATTLAIACLTAVVLLVVHVTRDPAVPSAPGNYLYLADGRCELHRVGASPADSLVLRPISCLPANPTLGVAAGFTAITQECGNLVFAPLSLAATLVCQGCSGGGPTPGQCPLARLDAASTLRWTPIE